MVIFQDANITEPRYALGLFTKDRSMDTIFDTVGYTLADVRKDPFWGIFGERARCPL